MCLCIPLILNARIDQDSLSAEKTVPESAISLLSEAISFKGKDPERAISIARLASRAASREVSDSLKMESEKFLGLMHTYKGMYDTALVYFFSAEKICKELRLPLKLAGIHASLGAVYTYKKEYEKGIEWYSKAQAYLGRMSEPDKQLQRRVFHNFAFVYEHMDNAPMALDYYKKSLVISEQLGDSISQAHTMNAIGEVFRKQENSAEAQPWYSMALSIFNEKGHRTGKMIVLNNLGNVYLDQGLLKKAESLYREAISINQKQNNSEITTTLLINMGIVSRKKGNLAESIEYLQKAQKIAIEQGYLERQVECLDEIHKVHRELNQFKKAYEVQTEYQRLKDSLQAKNTTEELLTLQQRFDSREKENEILKQNSEIQQLLVQRQRLWVYLLIVGLALIGFLSITLWNKYKQTHRLNLKTEKQSRKISTNNKELVAANRDLQQFAYIVSHDMKEPLRNIKNYTKLLGEKLGEDQDEESEEFLGFITGGVEHMKNTIDDLLKYVVVKTKNYDVDEVDLNDVFLSTTEILSRQLEASGAQVEGVEFPKLKSNRSLLILLFQNLISNAVKFRSDEPPVIRISCEPLDQGYQFAVEDNGIGIPQTYQKRIFSVFYRLHDKESYEGNGIGLSICQRIVDMHGGNIWVTSEPGKGSTFHFELGDMVSHEERNQSQA